MWLDIEEQTIDFCGLRFSMPYPSKLLLHRLYVFGLRFLNSFCFDEKVFYSVQNSQISYVAD